MPTANAEMAHYWNEVSGQKWVDLQALIDRQLAGLGERAIERAALRPGERVLDVGCGCGATSLALAARVGVSGEVLGIDLSGPMLARARERATQSQLANVRFAHTDAQTAKLPDGFDLLFSRFGVMFFDAPEVAFTNLRRALRPGGRLTFVCWQALARNPWMLVPLAAVAPHVTLPAPPAPGSPGPFAFADAERVRGILQHAGFTDLAIESLEQELHVGPGDLEGSIDFLLAMGPAGFALREAPDPAAATEAARGSLRDALKPYLMSDGIRMPSACWIVSARSPEA